MNRLGAERPAYNRIIKITLHNSKDREEFLKNSAKLKDVAEPWGEIFIK